MKLIIAIMLIISSSAYSQTREELQAEVIRLQKEVIKLRKNQVIQFYENIGTTQEECKKRRELLLENILFMDSVVEIYCGTSPARGEMGQDWGIDGRIVHIPGLDQTKK
jgi:hypothetical protein